MNNWKLYLIIICLTAIAIIAVIQNLMDDHKATDGHSSQAGAVHSSPLSSAAPATFKEDNMGTYPEHIVIVKGGESGGDCRGGVGGEVTLRTPSPHEIEMIVTAYCPEACCCGRYADGLTASGKPAVGLIIAAPPEYPFGTIMEVPGYGAASVEDRGGAIKGNKLDLLFETHQEALNFGRQTLMVRILK